MSKPVDWVRAHSAPGCRCAVTGQRAASVEELVSLHDVQAYRQARCQNSRCQFGAPLPWAALLERHRPAGGTAASAGVPVGFSVSTLRAGRLRIAGACWKNSQRGFEEREPSPGLRSLVLPAWGRSLSMAMLTSVETSSCVAPASFGLLSRLAPRVGCAWLGSFALPCVRSCASERQLPG